MNSPQIYVGFDLGTTNSAAAVFDGADVQVVRGATGATLTPSVVRIDAKGRVSVGHRAARMAAKDPDNTHREFKRLMGTDGELVFAASGVRHKPHELAGLILKAMRQDVADMTGTLPSKAVVSVPALFELPQNKATSLAAQAAGFDQVELIQEPIASALASGWTSDDRGAWLVYDIGGGTFDVSLLETRDGLLRVVGHDGDNFLGGRDFDRVVVDWAIEEIARQYRVVLDRSNPAHSGALDQIRHAAELAKIELSRSENVALIVDEPLCVGDDEVEVELTLTRETLEDRSRDLIERSLAVCTRLLKTHGLERNQLARVVMVGGPSVMPMVQDAVRRGLEVPIATGHDPMTLVAQGAALYAATMGLPATSSARPAAVGQSSQSHRIWCQYPPVTADLEPHVVGRFEFADTLAPAAKVSVARIDSADETTWNSPTTDVDDDGSFVLGLQLIARTQNRFRISAASNAGEAVAVEPALFTIIHGVTIGDPPLGRTIGVALANNQVHTYFERGTALPARRTFTHHTVATLTQDDELVLKVPIVQGEFEEANLCQVVGTLEISGAGVKKSIPSGTPVDVTLALDRGGSLTATARIADSKGKSHTFEGVAQLIMPQPSLDSLQKSFAAAQAKLADSQSAAFGSGDTNAVSTLQRLDAVLLKVKSLIEAAGGGDDDAGQQAARLLREVDADLAQLEAARNWPEFEAEALDTLAWALSYVATYGTETEAKLVDRAGDALHKALEHKRVGDAKRQLRIIHRAGNAAFRRDPDSWRWEFEHWTARLDEATNIRKAKKLEQKGRDALAHDDSRALRSSVTQLRELFPADPMTRRLSHDSGVM